MELAIAASWCAFAEAIGRRLAVDQDERSSRVAASDCLLWTSSLGSALRPWRRPSATFVANGATSLRATYDGVCTLAPAPYACALSVLRGERLIAVGGAGPRTSPGLAKP